MITTTMSISDKCFEAWRVWGVIYNFHNEKVNIFRERLKKQTTSSFPYYNRFKFVDDKKNEWHVVFLCKSKEWRKKGVYFCFAYLTYEIPPMRKENQTNSGKGFISCNPEHMGRYYSNRNLVIEDDGFPPFIYEVVPHAMNRYNERYLKPKGLDKIDFTRKVEMMLSDWINYDVAADLWGDKSTKNNLKEGTFPYDVTMQKGGILKGTLFPDMSYIQFYTYISKDMMYEDQKRRFETMTKEYYKKFKPTDLQKNLKI